MAHRELNLRERRAIEDVLNAKIPVREIAAEIGRHVSTIYREIKRNFRADDAFPKTCAGYFGHAVHQRRLQRRSAQHNTPDTP